MAGSEISSFCAVSNMVYVLHVFETLCKQCVYCEISVQES